MIQIGDFQIALINDGTVHVDPGGLFGLTPRALYQQRHMPAANHTLPMTLTCLLVRAHGKTIVVDTGLGRKLNARQRANWLLEQPDGDLIDGLARQGLRPEDVDIVIDTHLHADHCAGNTVYNVAGDESSGVRPAFPNAVYYVQRREYADAMRPNERTRATYVLPNYQPLVASGQMHLLDGDTEIVPGIFGVVAPGHTPAMMVIRFESGGQHALFLTDLSSYAIHFEKLGWMTAYDVEPLVTLESKRRWRQWASETGALLIFQHDPLVKAARYVAENTLEAVEVDFV